MTNRNESTLQPAWIDYSELKGRLHSHLEEVFRLPHTFDVTEIHKGRLSEASGLDFLGSLSKLASDDYKLADTYVTRSQTHREQESVRASFSCLRKYDGTIFRRDGDTFWAHLRENSNDRSRLEAEFDVRDLPESDRPIALEGTPIVWTIGYAKESGTVRQQSILYVRRINAPSTEEVQRAVEQVGERMREIRWE